MIELWTEKYRPKTLKEYVFVDEAQKQIIHKWVSDGMIPHLLLSGHVGTGKTALAKVLLHELGAHDYDVLEINASMDNGIDMIRERIAKFASTIPFGKCKYVILDEADYLTKQAQMPLRNLIEKYHEFVRFILTANYPERIDDALHSRLENFHITALNMEQYVSRVLYILENEKVSYGDEIGTYITDNYPDLRSCIKQIQTNCIDGVLNPASSASNTEKDFYIEAVAHFKDRRFKEARKVLTAKAQPNDYPAMYRMLYDNLEWWSEDENVQIKAILEIAEGIRWHGSCADPEINFCATLIKLEKLI